MVYDHTIEACADSQESPGLFEIQQVLDAVDASALIERLRAYRRTGRPGYPLRSLWRAYLASFILNLPSTNALIRRLQDDLELRLLCGFSTLPGRRTFNRFILRLADHTDLVNGCMADLTRQLQTVLPGFGNVVAIDSTTVKSHSNANREPMSDPDASWTAKNAANGKDGEKEWSYGFKYHAVADATHDLPISGIVTTASRNDSPFLPKILDHAASEHEWFAPKYVIADRGYDANSNHKAVIKRGATPIIHIRDMKKNAKKVQDRYLDGIIRESRPAWECSRWTMFGATRRKDIFIVALRRDAGSRTARVSFIVGMNHGQKETPITLDCSERFDATARSGRLSTACVRASSGFSNP